ncbi:MAG: DoxX-like family protein [Planctomycetota bacterium]
MDTLWERTQTPNLHERWDIRFTEIEYLPRPDPTKPQRFLYATRIGFGLRIKGQGESVAERLTDQSRTSSLRFWSDDPRSLIAKGSGYWKYVPTEDGIRFFTGYNYRTRLGLFGRALDLVFRPLMGWATAWGFDCLRLWIERGIKPENSIERSLTHAACRASLAAVWLYQGIVPKLLFGETSGELDTIRASGLFEGAERTALYSAGVVEILFGLALLIWWRARSLLLVVIAVLILLGVAAALAEPPILARQFNPVTLNLSMIALAAVGWRASRDLPSAANCLRQPPESRAQEGHGP